MPSFYGAHRGQDPRARARRSEKRHGERQTRRCSLARLIESEHDARATFFVLGWIAERQRELVREIAERGHEIASHGFDHRRVTTLTRDEFRESVRTSKRILEDVTGQAVFGYRAPNFSIVRGGEWALKSFSAKATATTRAFSRAVGEVPDLSAASATLTVSSWLQEHFTKSWAHPAKS